MSHCFLLRPSRAAASRAFSILIFVFRIAVAKAIVCNSQYCPNFGNRCRTIFECDFGMCYNKVTFDRSSNRIRYVESGCSTEFQTSMAGKCVGDTKEGYTCACKDSSHCNFDHRQLQENNAHRKVSDFPLRQLSCYYSDDYSICQRHGSYHAPCNVSGRSYCTGEREIGSTFARSGSIDYSGYFERASAAMTKSADWLCEELEYQLRWRCTCRSTDCSTRSILEETLKRKIDRSATLVQCRDFDSTRSDDELNRNRTCVGHVCYAEYERSVIVSAMTADDEIESEVHDPEPKVKDVRLTLGCRNFSHPDLFYGWAYNKVYGHKQKGQMFCRTNMCNDFTVQQFRNASLRLEASAAQSSTTALVSLTSTVFVLLITTMLSLSSG